MDPVVDSIFLTISYLILPSIARILRWFPANGAAFWAFSRVVVFEKSARFVKVTVLSDASVVRLR
jgi:hypothetical protein